MVTEFCLKKVELYFKTLFLPWWCWYIQGAVSLKVGLTCLFKKKSHFTVYTQLLFWNVPYSNLHINCIKRCFQNKILWQTELSCDTFIWFVLLLHRVDWIQAEQKQAVTAASWIFVPNFSPLKSCKLKWVVLQLHFCFFFQRSFTDDYAVFSQNKKSCLIFWEIYFTE